MNTLTAVKKELKSYANPKKAEASAWFFKTGEGQYGYGDKFLGVTVPEQRKIAKKYPDLNFADLEQLLNSEIHEERLTALLILVERFKKGDEKEKKFIFDFYVLNIKRINNWDLVDLSAPNIIGAYLLDKKITLLLAYAKSGQLWEKRIAMVSTFAFTYNGKPGPTFLVADLLLDEREDLIQKAVGWMLREVGKRVSEKKLEDYLKSRYKKMGRTALRYAIEHFDNETRKKYLSGTI